MGNKNLLIVLDDKVLIDRLLDSLCFDMGESEWHVRSQGEDMLQAIRERVAELDQVHGIKTDSKCADGKCPTLNLKTCDECGKELVLVYVKNYGKVLVHKEKRVD